LDWAVTSVTLTCPTFLSRMECYVMRDQESHCTRPCLIIDEIRQLQCAGLNRHEAEEEESSRERTSDPLGPEFCVGHREMHGEA